MTILRTIQQGSLVNLLAHQLTPYTPRGMCRADWNEE